MGCLTFQWVTFNALFLELVESALDCDCIHLMLSSFCRTVI